MRILRIGLVGCGGIGAVHARAWAQVPDTTLAACDADLSRARGAAPDAYGRRHRRHRGELDDSSGPPLFSLGTRAAVARRKAVEDQLA